MDVKGISIALGGRIRAIRKAKGISQEKLAEMAKLHPTYISNIENGKVNASLVSYINIAKALGTPIEELVNIPKKKADSGIENDIAELIAIARGLSSGKQKIFIKAAKGLIEGIE